MKKKLLDLPEWILEREGEILYNNNTVTKKSDKKEGKIQLKKTADDKNIEISYNYI